MFLLGFDPFLYDFICFCKLLTFIPRVNKDLIYSFIGTDSLGQLVYVCSRDNNLSLFHLW